MASSRDRERKLARAKIDRQMARRADKVRIQRQRQSQVGIGLAILLVLAGVGWLTNWYGITSKSAKPQIISATCSWTPADTTSNTNLKDTGTPPPAGMPTSGTETMAIKTDQGDITAQLDVAKAPCTAASFSFLASTQYFDKTSCHRLVTSGIYVLQCGDPSGTGNGGPAYTIPDENLPVDFTPVAGATPAPSASSTAPAQVIYPAGTLAMANTGKPDTGGSQFFLVYKDSPLAPTYTVFGKITSGMDVLQKIAAAGAKPQDAQGNTAPKLPVTINTLTVSAASDAAPSASTSPSAVSNS